MTRRNNVPRAGDTPRRATSGARAQPPATNLRSSTTVEHVGGDIIVSQAYDQTGSTSSRSFAATAVPRTTDAQDTTEALEWLGVGAETRLVNLHFVVGALKRRWRWVMCFAVAGLGVGVLLSVVFAPPPQAATTLLLTHPSASARTSAMVTDAQLLESTAVARRVVDSLHLAESPAAFASSYKATILSDDLLSISVSASSRADAVRRANVLAREYLRYRADVYQSQSDTIIDGLQERQAAIQAQIDELNQQLGAKADSTTSSDAATTALLARRANLNKNLTSMNDAIAAVTNSTAAVVGGSSAIDNGAAVERSMVQQLGRNALSGLAAGLAAGVALVILLAVTSNRVWRREDVAEAIRHSIDLSTGRIGVGRFSSAHASQRLITHPNPELAKVVAHLRSQVATSARLSLAVVAAGDVDVAAVSVCATAIALARDGYRVVVVDASKRSIVNRHRLFRQGESERANADARGGIRVVSPANGGTASTDAAEIVLVLATLDPAEGLEPIRPLASEAVVIVTAGGSTMATLRAASEMLEVAQIELRSVVLVNSSVHDESFGRLVDRQGNSPAKNSKADGHPVTPARP
jgi:capsular polysaccharide biosynthesis protein